MKPVINNTTGSDMRSLAEAPRPLRRRRGRACGSHVPSRRSTHGPVRPRRQRARRTQQLLELADTDLLTEVREAGPRRFATQAGVGEGLAQLGERPPVTRHHAPGERRVDTCATGQSHRDQIEEAAEGVAERPTSFCRLGPHGERRDDRESDCAQDERHPQRQYPGHIYSAERHRRERRWRPQQHDTTNATLRATCSAGVRPITRRSRLHRVRRSAADPGVDQRHAEQANPPRLGRVVAGG